MLRRLTRFERASALSRRSLYRSTKYSAQSRVSSTYSADLEDLQTTLATYFGLPASTVTVTLAGAQGIGMT